jgi:hypothetical protein
MANINMKTGKSLNIVWPQNTFFARHDNGRFPARYSVKNRTLRPYWQNRAFLSSGITDLLNMTAGLLIRKSGQIARQQSPFFL